MKLLDFDTINNMEITPNIFYYWASEALMLKSEALLPPKISLKPDIPGVFYNTMPAILPSLDRAIVKLVTRYPKREPSLRSDFLLYELSSGNLLALMDGAWITTMRTGAVAALSIGVLAKKDYKNIGFIGLGNTARATLKVLRSIDDRPITLRLYEYKDQAQLFAAEFSSYPNITFEYSSSPEELIAPSEVIVSAVTVFDEDICSDECFPEGCLVVPIHTRGFTNCDLFFDKVFGDDRGHIQEFRYFNRFKSFNEVSDVIKGNASGRTSDLERIIVYNIGIALQDLYFATKIEAKVDNAMKIELNPPTEKFWVKG